MCQKIKKAKSLKSGKISYNSTKSAQTHHLPEEEEPKQHQQPEEKEPKSQQSHEPRYSARSDCHEVPKVPAELEVIRGQQSAQTQRSSEVRNWPKPRGHPRLDSNSFFGRSAAQEARRRKRDVIRDVHPAGRQQLSDARGRQQPEVEVPADGPHQFLINRVDPPRWVRHDPQVSGK